MGIQGEGEACRSEEARSLIFKGQKEGQCGVEQSEREKDWMVGDGQGGTRSF